VKFHEHLATEALARLTGDEGIHPEAENRPNEIARRAFSV